MSLWFLCCDFVAGASPASPTIDTLQRRQVKLSTVESVGARGLTVKRFMIHEVSIGDCCSCMFQAFDEGVVI